MSDASSGSDSGSDSDIEIEPRNNSASESDSGSEMSDARDDGDVPPLEDHHEDLAGGVNEDNNEVCFSLIISLQLR